METKPHVQRLGAGEDLGRGVSFPNKQALYWGKGSFLHPLETRGPLLTHPEGLRLRILFALITY